VKLKRKPIVVFSNVAKVHWENDPKRLVCTLFRSPEIYFVIPFKKIHRSTRRDHRAIGRN
jgi:hypothetical protein